jgi:two-component system, NtrC family, sensor histidine kinase HydH
MMTAPPRKTNTYRQDPNEASVTVRTTRAVSASCWVPNRHRPVSWTGAPSLMSERKQQFWLRWVRLGALAIAALAALSLTFTALFARQALDAATDVIVRGEADMLLSEVLVDLWRLEEVTPRSLASVIAQHDTLRYVALVSREDGHVLVDAGSPALARGLAPVPDVIRRGARVRVSALIPPRAETRAALGGGPPEGPAFLQPFPRPRLVIELEPPVVGRLQQAMRRILFVTGVAGLVLLTLATAWATTWQRLVRVQVQAESERQLVALGRASSIIAHELRNPLAALKGHAQLLLEDMPERLRPKVGRVVEGAERLERLSNVLLDFVREAPLDPSLVTPADLADRVLTNLPSERVSFHSAEAPAQMRVDAERLALALRNLVANALQAGEGRVDVIVREHARQVVLEVRDHGPGLPPDAADRIFDPFVTTKAQGTGLGLSVARRIVEQHGGTLTGENHPDGGAIFRIVLPLGSRARTHP